MIRNYSNVKIYRNFKIVKVVSAIATVFAIIGLTIDVIIITILRLDIETTSFVFYHLCSLVIPILQISPCQKPNNQSTTKETKLYNDFYYLLTIIILSLTPVVLYTIFVLLDYNVLIYLPNILIYISDAFLIYNCVLIKHECEYAPPQLVMEKYEERARYNNETKYKSLIEKCGIRFFIKYCKQIKRLPLRDVEITEFYSPAELEERLQAAKKIIELNLTEFTLTEILKSYGDILDEAELAQAKSLLAELQSS